MVEHEEAVRRALREVAATTAAAAASPPELAKRRTSRRPSWRRPQRMILGAVAAAAVVVAGVLVIAAGRDGDGSDREVVTGPDDSTSTTTTTVASATVGPPRRAALADGDGWQVVREDGASGLCILLITGGAESRHCGLEELGELPGPVWTAALPNGWSLLVVAAGAADLVEGYGASGVIEDNPPPLVADPLRDGASFVVTDMPPDALLLRRGDAILGAVYAGALVTGEVFGDYAGYDRTNGSLSLGLFQEIGAYADEGRTCVLARQLTPTPAVVADHCVDGRPSAVSAVLVPTTYPIFLDLFAIAPLSGGGEWSCELPSGKVCGGGEVTDAPELGVSTISGYGPIVVDDDGTRADRITLIVGDERVDVEVPEPR